MLIQLLATPVILHSVSGDFVNYQNYYYQTVQIGDQCWFTENLRSEYYENGDAIPSNLSDGQWENTLSGAVAVFGEVTPIVTASVLTATFATAWSLNEYGRLYNWYAVDDVRGCVQAVGMSLQMASGRC